MTVDDYHTQMTEQAGTLIEEAQDIEENIEALTSQANELLDQTFRLAAEAEQKRQEADRLLQAADLLINAKTVPAKKAAKKAPAKKAAKKAPAKGSGPSTEAVVKASTSGMTKPVVLRDKIRMILRGGPERTKDIIAQLNERWPGESHDATYVSYMLNSSDDFSKVKRGVFELASSEAPTEDPVESHMDEELAELGVGEDVAVNPF